MTQDLLLALDAAEGLRDPSREILRIWRAIDDAAHDSHRNDRDADRVIARSLKLLVAYRELIDAMNGLKAIRESIRQRGKVHSE